MWVHESYMQTGAPKQALENEEPPSSFMLASFMHKWSAIMDAFRCKASIIKVKTMLIKV